MSAPATFHASAILIGERILLVRGPSGSGKSTLLLQLLEQARQRADLFAVLVCDDRVAVARHGAHLVARAPEPLKGLIEARGLGLLTTSFEAAGVVGAVLEFDQDAPRYPDALAVIELEGVVLPHIRLKPHSYFGLLQAQKCVM